MSDKQANLPIYKNIKIPHKIAARKHFVNFLDQLVYGETGLRNSIKEDNEAVELSKKIKPEMLDKLQRMVDKTIEYYQKYGNLIKESKNVNKKDIRYFDFYASKSFEDIYDNMQRLIEINNTKKFANKYLRSYSDFLYNEDGDLDAGVMDKFEIIKNSSLSSAEIRETFQNIASIKGNKESFNNKLNQIISGLSQTRGDVLERVNKENLNVDIKFDENDFLVLQINDYNASVALGVPAWCISTDEGYYEDYLGNIDEDIYLGKHYFAWNFAKIETDKMSKIAFTLDLKGDVSASYDRDNDPIEDIVGSYIKEHTGRNINKIMDHELIRINNVEGDDLVGSFINIRDFVEKTREEQGVYVGYNKGERNNLSRFFKHPLSAINRLSESYSKNSIVREFINFSESDIYEEYENFPDLISVNEGGDVVRDFAQAIINAHKTYLRGYDEAKMGYTDIMFHCDFDDERLNEDYEDNFYFDEKVEYINDNGAAFWDDMSQYVIDYVSSDLTTTFLTEKIVGAKPIYFMNKDIKDGLYNHFEEYIPEILNKKVINNENAPFSRIGSHFMGFESCLMAPIVKPYFLDNKEKLTDSERVVICATLLASPNKDDNKFAFEHIPDAFPALLGNLITQKDDNTAYKKELIIKVLNSKSFKDEYSKGEIDWDTAEVIMSLADQKDIVSKLTDETREYLGENVMIYSIHSKSGRKKEHGSYDEVYKFDLAERLKYLVDEKIIKPSALNIAINESTICFGDLDKYKKEGFKSLCDYATQNIGKDREKGRSLRAS